MNSSEPFKKVTVFCSNLVWKQFRQDPSLTRVHCLGGGSWSTVEPLASALEGPKPYSCLPNQHRGNPSWKKSTRHSQKASQPYSLSFSLSVSLSLSVRLKSALSVKKVSRTLSFYLCLPRHVPFYLPLFSLSLYMVYIYISLSLSLRLSLSISVCSIYIYIPHFSLPPSLSQKLYAIYIYTYMCAVKLLSGPSLAILGVIIWAK